MQLLKEAICNYPKTKLPSTLEVKGNAILDFYSQRDAVSRVNFGAFIEKALNAYRNAFCGSAVTIEECFIERASLLKIDTKTRLIHPVDDEELEETPINQLVAKRVICKIGAKTSGNAEILPTLAISLSEKDEQFAFGNDVTICSNFTVFSGNNNLHSGRKLMGNVAKYDVNDLLKVLMPIFEQSESRFEQDLISMERFKQIEVNRTQWYAFVGKLMEQIHYVNYARGNHFIATLPKEMKELPLTQNQLSSILVESVKPAHQEYAWQPDNRTSAWNVINWGTERLKSTYTGNPSTNVLTSHLNWVELVEKNLCAN